MNKNQLKSFIKKTINEQNIQRFNAKLLTKLSNEGKPDILNWIKKNGIDQMPLSIQYEIINLILKSYDDVPIGLQKIIDKYIDIIHRLPYNKK